MSEARLRQKLVQAGYREVDVAKFDRATLLEYYAKVLLTETAYVPAKEEQEEGEEAGDSDGEKEAEFAESDAGVQHTAGGDMSAEEKRIAMKEGILVKSFDRCCLKRENWKSRGCRENSNEN